MLYSEKSSITNVNFIEENSKLNPIPYDEVKEIIFRYDDSITQLIKKREDLLLSKKIIVCEKNDSVTPIITYVKNKKIIQLNIDRYRTFLREHVATTCLLYDYLYSNAFSRRNKDRSIIPFISLFVAKSFYTVNKRPVQEEDFMKRAIVYSTGHYLLMANDGKINKKELYTEVSKHTNINVYEKTEIENYLKLIKEKVVNNYDSKEFLNIVSDDVLNSIYEITLSRLISRFTIDYIYGLDEPSYMVYHLIGGKFFKTSTMNTFLPSNKFTLLFSYVTSFMK